MMSVASSSLLRSIFRLCLLRHDGETGSGEVAKRRAGRGRPVIPISVVENERRQQLF